MRTISAQLAPPPHGGIHTIISLGRVLPLMASPSTHSMLSSFMVGLHYCAHKSWAPPRLVATVHSTKVCGQFNGWSTLMRSLFLGITLCRFAAVLTQKGVLRIFSRNVNILKNVCVLSAISAPLWSGVMVFGCFIVPSGVGPWVSGLPACVYCVVIVAIITNASAAFQLQFPPSSDWFIGYFWWASPIPFRAMPYSGTFWGVGSLNAS